MAREEYAIGGKAVSLIQRLWYTISDSVFPRSRTLLAFDALTLSDIRALARPRSHSAHCMSLFSYSDPRIRAAIWELKYRGNRSVTKSFASLLFEELANEASETSEFSSRSTPIVVPIPTPYRRMRERGFNQIELLLEEILALDTTGMLESGKGVLAKSRETRPQTRLGRRVERVRNIRGSFIVQNPNRVRGRFIILLDDVVTTGSTMNEARDTLLEAGARRVTALAIAH